MSSDDAGGAPSPTAIDGTGEWTTVVRSGRGAAPSAAAPSGSPVSNGAHAPCAAGRDLRAAAAYSSYIIVL